jgi:hypothetical protein
VEQDHLPSSIRRRGRPGNRIAIDDERAQGSEKNSAPTSDSAAFLVGYFGHFPISEPSSVIEQAPRRGTQHKT